MSIRYELGANDILQILGLLKEKNMEISEKYDELEKELNLTLPKSLKNFLIATYDVPLLQETEIFSDYREITTLSRVCYHSMRFHNDYLDKQAYFGFVDVEEQEGVVEEEYEDGDDEERLEGGYISQSEKYGGLQNQYENWTDEDFENTVKMIFSQNDDFLLIGSNLYKAYNNEEDDFNYGWDSEMYGIRVKDLNKKNPPVYINYHYHNFKVWHKFSSTLSEFLLMVVCDALRKENGERRLMELYAAGWKHDKYTSIYGIHFLLAKKEIERCKLHCIRSANPLKEYDGAFKIACCYEKEEQALYIIQYAARAVQVDVISKGHERILVDMESALYKEIFGSSLNLFSMQEFVEILNPKFIYVGHERINQNGDDRVVINVYACDADSKCDSCAHIEEVNLGYRDVCNKKILCPFCGQEIFNGEMMFSVEMNIGLRIKGTAIMLKRTIMNYHCGNPGCILIKEPFKGRFTSLDIQNDLEKIDEVYIDFMHDEWNERQVVQLLDIG